MKFKKGFGVILEPDYNIKEEVSEEEQRERVTIGKYGMIIICLMVVVLGGH